MAFPKANAQIIAPSRSHRFFGQYVIKERFQFKYSLMVLGTLLLTVLALWLECHWMVQRILENNTLNAPEIKIQLALLPGIVGKTGILISFVGFGIALYMSHFVAGPLYRFEKSFGEVREGNLAGYMRLRKKDEFQETAEHFNQMVVSLRNKVNKERESVTALAENLKTLSQKLREAGRVAEATELDHLLVEFKNLPPQIKTS